jgi:hypothetical protein
MVKLEYYGVEDAYREADLFEIAVLKDQYAVGTVTG